ncbi:MAG: hypothetical protein EXS25_04040 [Pedosphaera sp.]|nr:hypothetical protein [Pedosphaera sp.]
MRSISLIGLFVVLLQVVGLRVQAFSLLGPFSSWQTPDIGYDTVFAAFEQGGPRLRGDEYRLSTPIVTYGVDGSFAEYFGERGMQAIDDAFNVFNAITNVSAMSENLTEYPMKSDGVNPTAKVLGLLDLKTTVMAQTLASMGLTAPDRWCWSVRSRDAGPPPTYSVANFNYDPVSGRPSRYVNETLYSYVIREIFDDSGAPVLWDAREIPVDSANPTIALASMVNNAVQATGDDRLIRAVNPVGRYFTGLTRDDMGGLRYIYRPENRNYEGAPQGSVRGSGVVSNVGGNSGPTESPWTIIDGRGFIGTNVLGGGGTVRPFANLGVRGGVDKVRFIRVNLDPILRISPFPVIISYPEIVLSNGVAIRQVISRTQTVPDYVFSAADNGVSPPTPVSQVDTQLTFNNTSIGGAEGPGNIEPRGGIVFSKLGIYTLNRGNTDEEDGIPGILWSSFDGSTNAPVIYPVGTRLSDLESTLLYLRPN